jgi:plastocyanin
MKIISRAFLLAAFISAFVVPSAARAGDIKGQVSAEGLSSPEGIAVYVDSVPGKKFDPPATHATVDQRDMKFVPKTIIVERGTTVDFLNSDQVVHNVYWPSIGGNKTLRHSLTIISPGQKKSFQFDTLGAAQLLCNFHADMLGYILIVPTPYFALTGSDGSFTIKGVPPGTYTLKTWSPEGKPATQTITVGAADTKIDIAVKK